MEEGPCLTPILRCNGTADKLSETIGRPPRVRRGTFVLFCDIEEVGRGVIGGVGAK